MRVFQVGSSKRNTAIERHWRDLNLVTRKWVKEFDLLRALGFFEDGCNNDIYSLTSIYHGPVSKNLKMYYAGLSLMKKKKTTKNPRAYAKLRRRFHIYSSPKTANFLTELNAAEISVARSFGLESCPGDELSLWEHDSILNRAGRQQRQLVIDALEEEGKPLYLRYAAHRAFSRSYASGADGVSSLRAAYDAVDELNAAVADLSSAPSLES